MLKSTACSRRGQQGLREEEEEQNGAPTRSPIHSFRKSLITATHLSLISTMDRELFHVQLTLAMPQEELAVRGLVYRQGDWGR